MYILAAVTLNHLKHNYVLNLSSFCQSSEHMQEKGEPNMRLHRLGKCDRRSTQGIMSGRLGAECYKHKMHKKEDYESLL